MYASQQDLIDRFGDRELIDISDRADPPTGVIDATVVSRALEDADNLINGYVAGRYGLPMVDVPPLLKQIACDLARYYLYDESVTDLIKQRFEDAKKDLDKVSAGKIILQVAGIETPSDSNSGILISEGPERLHTVETLDGL